MAFTQQQIEEQLARVKERKKIQPAPSYKEFMPETLGFQKRDDSMRYGILEDIESRGQQATQLAQVKANNRRSYEEMQRQQAALQRARKQLRRAKNSQPAYAPPSSSGPRIPGTPANFKVGVGQYLTTFNWRGRNITVNRFAAPRFQGLLNDLYKAGYRPASIGGFNNRNIAGSNQKSLHAYGLAIDIDPARNPVQYGSNNHALPPNVAALAAKYGLSWGGSWNSYKDPMHFSVPYGGRE